MHIKPVVIIQCTVLVPCSVLGAVSLTTQRTQHTQRKGLA